MKRIIGAALGLIVTIFGLFKSVYIENEVPEKYKAINNTYKKNDQETYFPRKHPLRVFSWNIFRFSYKKRVEETLKKYLSQYHPDFLFFQEAPVYSDGSKFSNLSLFEEYNHFYAPLHQVIGKESSYHNFSHSGQLILSKIPFKKTDVYELPTVTSAFKVIFGSGHIIKRIALYVQVEDEGKNIGLYNVHLENACRSAGRLEQLKHLLRIVEKNQDDVVILGGDMNTFYPGFFEKGLTYLGQRGFVDAVFSLEKNILPRLDHLFVKGAKANGRDLSKRGSDHKALIIEVAKSNQKPLNEGFLMFSTKVLTTPFISLRCFLPMNILGKNQRHMSFYWTKIPTTLFGGCFGFFSKSI